MKIYPIVGVIGVLMVVGSLGSIAYSEINKSKVNNEYLSLDLGENWSVTEERRTETDQPYRLTVDYSTDGGADARVAFYVFSADSEDTDEVALLLIDSMHAGFDGVDGMIVSDVEMSNGRLQFTMLADGFCEKFVVIPMKNRLIVVEQIYVDNMAMRVESDALVDRAALK